MNVCCCQTLHETMLKSIWAGNQSHRPCCWCCLDILIYFWSSPKKAVSFFFQLVIGDVLFLLKVSSKHQHVYFWFTVWHCCLQFLPSLALSLFFLGMILVFACVYESVCVCLRECFIPGEIKSLGPYVLQQKATRDSTFALFNNKGGLWPKVSLRFNVPGHGQF